MDATIDITSERERAFAEALRADGLRMTHQRLEVIRELASATHHPAADELFRAVRKRVPTISRDTVYRTLSTLAAHGLAQRIEAYGGARFDPNVSMHPHFMCVRCGRILDIPAGHVTAPEFPVEMPGVGEVISVHMDVRGVCAGCVAASDAGPAPGSV